MIDTRNPSHLVAETHGRCKPLQLDAVGFLLSIEMNSDYPKKTSHYAHRAFRLMHKTSLAAEIGRDAFCLIAVIMHTEDAARYKGPVKFWNSQLQETLGFAKWESFDRARQRAIESGWLHYQGNGRRSCGEYWTTIPGHLEDVPDTVIEEALYPDDGYKDGYNAGYNDGYKRGYDEGINGGTTRGQSGVQPGDKQGELPNPIPIPNPIPKETASPAPESKPKDQWQIPYRLDTPRVRELLDRFVSMRKQIRKPIKSLAFTSTILEHFESVEHLEYAIQFCIANQYQGLKPDYRPESKPATQQSYVPKPKKDFTGAGLK